KTPDCLSIRVHWKNGPPLEKHGHCDLTKIAPLREGDKSPRRRWARYPGNPGDGTIYILSRAAFDPYTEETSWVIVVYIWYL
ncbi:hypothetical protein AVEN_70635-1, partial [Araneus ventricosus]